MAHENKSNRNIGLLYTFASIMYHPLLFSNLQHLRNNPKKKKNSDFHKFSKNEKN